MLFDSCDFSLGKKEKMTNYESFFCDFFFLKISTAINSPRINGCSV